MAGVSRAEQAAIDRIIRNTASSGSSSSSNAVTDNKTSSTTAINIPPPSSSSSRPPTASPYDDDGGSGGGNNNPPSSSNPSAHVAHIEQLSHNNTQKLKAALRYSSQSNELADDTVGHLSRQKETIGRSLAASEDTAGILSSTKKALKDMKWSMLKERVVKMGIIGALVLIIILIIYFKFLRRR